MKGKLIQIKEAAEILGISKLTLRNWDKEGKLTAYRHPINNYRVYRSEDIEKIIEKIESGEKPIKEQKRKLSTGGNEESGEKSKSFTLKVLHLSD
jgi:excisionase family DNA binding protein